MNENNVFESNHSVEAIEPAEEQVTQPVYQVVPKRSVPVLPIVLLILALGLIGLGVWRLLDNNFLGGETDPEIVELELSPSTPTVITDNPDGETVAENTEVVDPRLSLPSGTVANNTPAPRTQTTTVETPKTETVTTVREVVVTKETLGASPRLDSCGSRDGDFWNAKFIFPEIKDADDYWIVIGTERGSDNVRNEHHAGRGEKQIFIRLENDKTYYVKYSVKINGKESEFSPILEAKCRGGNSSDSNNSSSDGYYGNFKGFRCIKDTHTCESTNDNNPPYANSKAGLEKCANECR